MLDTAFGTDGVAAYSGSYIDIGLSTAIQADGKVLVAGYSGNGIDYDMVLARYTPEGVMDTGFGTGGVVRYDSGDFDVGYSLVIQADGKILVAGYSESSADRNIVLWRYNAEGSLDTSFGTGGLVSYDADIFDIGRSVALQADGKVLVAGVSSADLLQLRYGTDGALDSGYGAGGAAVYDGGSADFGRSVAVQSDGKVLVAGYSHNLFDNDFVLVRFK
jgi:uncharacterized delta-60 repeat protein